jgi:uncharacterized membrane protein (DUF373 family)
VPVPVPEFFGKRKSGTGAGTHTGTDFNTPFRGEDPSSLIDEEGMDKPKDGESLVVESKDTLLNILNKTLVVTVKILAVLMVLLIIWGLVDVVLVLYHELLEPPFLLINFENLVQLFGNFLVILIGIEIFLNIVFYLKRDAVHVPLVLATALTAIARKVIILDYNKLTADYIYATAAAVFAVGLVYWLVTKKDNGT